jgi:hypothetical protein
MFVSVVLSPKFHIHLTNVPPVTVDESVNVTATFAQAGEEIPNLATGGSESGIKVCVVSERQPTSVMAECLTIRLPATLYL